jgi:hypothetical protein
MTKKKDEGKQDQSPWQKGTTVKGVVPPGRRLSDDKRKTRWSASGVKGVTPPGNLDAAEGPGADWYKKEERAKEKKAKENQRALEKAKAKPGKQEVQSMRPTAGFVPDPFSDLKDPSDLKEFLRLLNEFLDKHKLGPELAEGFASLITQSHSPFEIVVAFTVLSALVGKSTQMRRRYGVALERGAKVYFNLIGRLEKNVQVPRGLVPETVNALFYNLPQVAYQVPYAYATHAFVRMMELLRDGSNHVMDREVGALGEELYRRFIEGRSFGDQALVKMFPFELPPWASAE